MIIRPSIALLTVALASLCAVAAPLPAFAQDAESQGRSEITPKADDKNSDSKKDESKSKDSKESTGVPPTQFRKAESPSGLQMGLTDSEITGQLPEDLQEFARKGALASAAKKWQEAREAFSDMVKAAPDNALALANLGMVEFRLGEFEAARDHLQASLDIKASVAHHWLALALCYYQMKNRDMALSCLFRARHEDERDPRVHLYLAVIARDFGWEIASEKELRRAIALDPEYTDAHFNLAMLYLEQEPPALELARRHYYNALDLGAKRDAKIEAAIIDLSNKR
jgi:tetratricopeptide (TPR) repeat protein